MGAQRDGVDMQALVVLTPEQKIEVEQKLLDALAETNDSRPFIAAGAMKLRTTAPILKQRLTAGFEKNICDYMSVHTAHALHLIEQWPGALPIILEIFQKTPRTPDRQWTRMMAVEALADFPNEKIASGALFFAVEDEDDFIGFLAIKSLKKIFRQNGQVMILLERLEETQKKPQRWKPHSLDQRQELFAILQNAVGVEMPKVAKQKKEIPSNVLQADEPNMRQMPMF
jgi:HEAT repeat protein